MLSQVTPCFMPYQKVRIFAGLRQAASAHDRCAELSGHHRVSPAA